MSTNCYRPPKEDVVVGYQNERLTNKHIQTLGILQELSRENKDLKTRVEDLEELNKHVEWEVREDQALLMYLNVVMKHRSDQWPVHIETKFWKGARDFLNTRCKKNRSEQACRRRVSRLKDKYRTMKEARKECSQCAELHAIAKDAKAKIKKIQEDCNRRVDQSNKTLTAKHKQEVLQLISDKLEAENDWLQERDKLQKLIDEQEETRAKLTEQLEQLKKHDIKIDVVNQRLDRTIAEVLQLKKENENLCKENVQLSSEVTCFRADAEKSQEYEKKNQELVLELEEHQQKVKELTFKVSRLETELDGEEERNIERNSARDKLRMRASNLSRDLKAKEKELAEYNEILRELRAQLQERTEQLELELVQKEKLILVIQKLEDELRARDLELHRRQAAPVKREESPSFRDFVQMKREINVLRDENEVLKQRNKKSVALPSLKAPSGDSKEQKLSNVNHQTLSTTWSSKWNKR